MFQNFAFTAGRTGTYSFKDSWEDCAETCPPQTAASINANMKFFILVLLVTQSRLTTHQWIYWFGHTKTVPKIRHQKMDGNFRFAAKCSLFIYDEQQFARAALRYRRVSLLRFLERQLPADGNLQLSNFH